MAQAGPISFLAGETTKPVTVPFNSDQLVEPNETFFVNLSNPVGATFGDNQAIGTITSTAGVPTVSIVGTTVTEGVDGSASFSVQLSAARLRSDRHHLRSSRGDSSGRQRFPGTWHAILGLPAWRHHADDPGSILDDTLDENDESFNVTLTGATGAAIGTGLATGTILDNDPQPLITISNVNLSDSGSTPNAIFTVSLSAPSSRPISIDFQTADGTATAGQDYQAQAGTAKFVRRDQRDDHDPAHHRRADRARRDLHRQSRQRGQRNARDGHRHRHNQRPAADSARTSGLSGDDRALATSSDE